MTRLEPDPVTETFLLHFLDSVEHAENVLDWAINPPNFQRFNQKEIEKAFKITTEIACNIRAIKNSINWLDSSDSKICGLSGSIVLNFERIARCIVENTPHGLKAAYWDMQMSCESALKCLSHQQSGDFKETHDLYCLYDNIPASHPIFERRLLSNLPDWQKIAKYRYGEG